VYHRILNLTLAAIYVAASIALLLDLFHWRP
jgi:hypothetical protein